MTLTSQIDRPILAARRRRPLTRLVAMPGWQLRQSLPPRLPRPVPEGHRP
jgi:hypothetical protein